MAAPPGTVLLAPAALPKVLGEAMVPGVKVVALLNRSGLLLGCSGDATSAFAARESSPRRTFWITASNRGDSLA